MNDCYEYLQRVKEIYAETLTRLAHHNDSTALELSEIFEDIGNLYLDIAADVRARYLEAQQAAAPPPPTAGPS